MTEQEIQKTILQYLGYIGITAWRNNTGKRGGVRYGKLGSGDIIGLLPNGRFLSIEVKTKTGIVSLTQRKFMAEINKSGGLAFVARSLEDVKKVIHS